ncbi:hypothetical protein OH77DRAFT_1378238, partial [Trametes cingulata]
VYWGPNNPANTSLDVPGPASIPRAHLRAALHALCAADPCCELRIWVVEGTHLARILSHWAPTLHRKQWPCAHADLLRTLVAVIRARPGPVRIYSVQDTP